MKVKLYKPFEHWYHGGVIWLISDPHLDDPDCKLMDPNWPSPEEQVKLINSKVGKKDVLIILGDIGNLEWVKKLKGYKVLVMGNHDKGASNYIRKESPVKIVGKDLEELKEDIKGIAINPGVHFNFKYYKHILYNSDDTDFVGLIDNQLFDEVYEGPVFINEKILLSHEPISIPGIINIHGHDHAGIQEQYWVNTKADINVCANVIGYSPRRLDLLVEGKQVQSIHRLAIDKAVASKRKR